MDDKLLGGFKTPISIVNMVTALIVVTGSGKHDHIIYMKSDTVILQIALLFLVLCLWVNQLFLFTVHELIA